MPFQVVLIEPPGYQHTLALAEIAETLVLGLRALGHQARATINAFAPDALNIVLGPHLLGADAVGALPPNTVLYNFEQVEDALFQWAPNLVPLFARTEVWDYSARNIERLRPLAPRLYHLPLGTVPEMTRIAPAAEQDIDVLFYGAVNDRRRALLKAIADAGIGLKAVFGCYGAARDQLIARARLVLNLHKHSAEVFEIPRVSYLLANRKAVVAEVSPTTEIDADLVDAVAGVPYEALVDTCRRLLADDDARHALEERGFQRMAARQETDYLRALLAERAG
jgi:hypothetical protein